MATTQRVFESGKRSHRWNNFVYVGNTIPLKPTLNRVVIIKKIYETVKATTKQVYNCLGKQAESVHNYSLIFLRLR